MQNPVTYLPQLRNIGLYYLALFPSSSAPASSSRSVSSPVPPSIGQVYAADLRAPAPARRHRAGPDHVCNPFALIPDLAAPAQPRRLVSRPDIAHKPACRHSRSWPAPKSSWPSARKPGGQPVQTHLPPRPHAGRQKAGPRDESHAGNFCPDDFTERVKTVSPTMPRMLGYTDPPRSFGLYRDGIRIASLPCQARLPAATRPARSMRCPHACSKSHDVLLIGASGGFRTAEVLALGASRHAWHPNR